MGKTTDTLEQQFQELDLKYKQVPRRKWMFRLATLLFVFFSFCLAMYVSIVKDGAEEKAVNAYLEVNDPEALNEIYDTAAIRGNTTAYSWYEENMLGIKNNIALAGLPWNCDANDEYRNEINGITAYVDNDAKTLVVQKDGDTLHVSKDAPGEVIATLDNVYFINKTAGNSLYVYDIAADQEVLVAEDDIDQFAVYGRYIFYLNSAEQIMRVSLESGETAEVANNIQRFYMAGELVAQNGTKVLKIALDGSGYSKLADNALLVGADSEHAYYTNFGVEPEEIENSDSAEDESETGTEETVSIAGDYVLYAINVNTDDTVPVDGRNSVIRAVYVSEDGILVDTIE